MLSFDITDRNIRIIRGTESNGKIKIQSSASINIDEGLVDNGFVKDIPKMATTINEVLKKNKMSEKEAVISISSNLVVFKELYIPKAKPAQFKTMVQNQMQQLINVTDEQCISYTIAGEATGENAGSLKVLATSCPRVVVDCYRKVFSMLSIALKSVSVSCNCISRIVLADKSIANKMPLLLVQIDPTFININLYENGQLAFARFASISPDDYDDKEDYVFQAVNENLFRMFQFQHSRSSSVIQNVVFYGDTSNFIRLINSLEQQDVKASLLQIPNILSGYENLEFSLYANAIGAMFKSKKDIESINLLDVDTGTTNQVQVSGSSLGLQIGGVFLAGAVLIGVGYGGLAIYNKTITNKIDTINAYINSKEIVDQLAEIDKTNNWITQLTAYKDSITIAKGGIDSQPVVRTDVFTKINGCLSGAKILDSSYAEGLLTLNCFADNQTIPAQFVENLNKLDPKYKAISYVGYAYAKAEGTDPTIAGPVGYTFAVTLCLPGEAELLAPAVDATNDTKTESGDAK